jgi:hypothetical protein
MLSAFEEEAFVSSRFFAHVLRPSNHSPAVLHFDRAIDMLQPFTSSREDLTAALYIRA